MPVIADWALDWETENKVEVTSSYFGVGVKGLMFDKLIGEEEIPIEIPEMPTWDETRPQQFQAYVSSYSIDSFFSSWVEVGDIATWLNATMVPANSTVQLTTSSLNELLPGIEDYYGPNVPMNIHFNVTSVGNIEIAEAN